MRSLTTRHGIAASNAQRPALYTRIEVHGENGASVGVETDAGRATVELMDAIHRAAPTGRRVRLAGSPGTPVR